ncbi:DUF6683 family protein [Sphingomonas sp. ac-8]|uniref:DUF6683 family protein n=1 Tax=Sphingomonas sp. ac-8 TaxID=3242977 RepID=UPI003A7F791E
MRPYVIALLAVLATAPASAQEWVNVDIWGNGILSQTALRHAEEATRQNGGERGGTARRPAQRRSNAATGLSFHRSGDLSGQIEEGVAKRLPQMVSLRFRMDDPSRFVRTAGTRAIYRRELQSRGLPENSVSGATALFLSVGWELANGRRLSPAQNAAIFRQTASGLQSSALARQSDPRRQQEAETRLIVAALWLEEARVRGSSAGLTRELSDAVWKDMKAITRNNMRAYAVTAKGFSER